jgi:hypothetical protein
VQDRQKLKERHDREGHDFSRAAPNAIRCAASAAEAGFSRPRSGASANSQPQALKRDPGSNSGGTTKVVPFPESSHVVLNTSFDRQALTIKASIVNNADHPGSGSTTTEGTIWIWKLWADGSTFVSSPHERGRSRLHYYFS